MPVSLELALPTRASLASEVRCRLRATSSRQALASLSTRVGRLASRSKLTEQRLDAMGAGGGGGIAGPLTATVAILESLFPRSSTTLQVTVTEVLLPAATVGAVRVAVEV